jgi:hypothetical protein
MENRLAGKGKSHKKRLLVLVALVAAGAVPAACGGRKKTEGASGR